MAGLQGVVLECTTGTHYLRGFLLRWAMQTPVRQADICCCRMACNVWGHIALVRSGTGACSMCRQTDRTESMHLSYKAVKSPRPAVIYPCLYVSSQDEPTSGLDSTAALKVRVARRWRTRAMRRTDAWFS